MNVSNSRIITGGSFVELTKLCADLLGRKPSLFTEFNHNNLRALPPQKLLCIGKSPNNHYISDFIARITPQCEIIYNYSRQIAGLLLARSNPLMGGIIHRRVTCVQGGAQIIVLS